MPLYFNAEDKIKYIVDQSTDYPIIAPLEFTASEEEPRRGFNTATQGSRLSGTVADDDGLKSIVIECKNASGEQASGYPVILNKLGEKKQYSLSQNLPSVNGTYTLKIEAYDLGDKKTTWQAKIRIQGNAPELDELVLDRNYITTTGNGVKSFTVSGTIAAEHTEENPLTISISGDSEHWKEIWNGNDHNYKNAELASWSYKVTPESGIISSGEGVKAIYIRADDTNGIPSSIKSLKYTIDNERPRVTDIILGENDKGYIVASPSPIKIETNDNITAGVVEYYYQVSNVAPAAVNSYEDFTAEGSEWTLGRVGDTVYINFDEGNTNVYAYAVDKAYNISDLKKVETKVDLNGSEVRITNTDTMAGAKFALKGTVFDSYSTASVVSVTVKETNQSETKQIKVNNGNWDSGDILFPTSNEDGTYTYTVTAVDEAGNQSSPVTYSVIYDNTAPTVEISKPVNDITWFNAVTAQTVEGKVNDGTGVGVEAVYYFIGNTQPATPSAGTNPVDSGWKLTEGVTSWKAPVTPETEGEAVKTIWITSKDKVGNFSVPVSRKINADTKNPTVTLISVTDTQNSEDLIAQGSNYYSKGKFKIKVKAEDTNLLSVKCNDAETAAETENGITYYTFSADQSGTYEFTATDKAGKTNTPTLKVNVTIDTESPETELQVTNLIGSFGGNTNVVNGDVTVKGITNDNDRVNSVSVKLYKETTLTGTPEYNLSGVTQGIEGAVTAPASNTIGNFVYVIDTTKLSKGTYTVVLEAKDRAGNSAEHKTQEIYVDQDSDKPVLSFRDSTDESVNDPSKVNEGGKGKNLFALGGKISFQAEDDDGVPTVKIWSCAYDETYSENPQGTYPNASTFEYALPNREGFYKVRVEITDKNELQGTSKEFVAGVSSGAPVVKITKNELTYVKNSEPVNITVQYKGGKTLTRTVVKESDSEEDIEDQSDDFTYDDPTGNFQIKNDTVKAKVIASERSERSARVTVTYTATNMFNETGSASYTYLIDNIKPSAFKYGTNPKDGNKDVFVYINGNMYNSNGWNKKADYSFKVGWTDAGYSDAADETGYTHSSEVTTVKYWITSTASEPSGDERGTFNPSLETEGSNKVFTINNRKIVGCEEGESYVWFKAVDAAGNESDFTSVCVCTDSTPPVLTLDQKETVFVPSTGGFKVTGKLVDANAGTNKSSGLNTYFPIRVFQGDAPLGGDYADWRRDGETVPDNLKNSEVAVGDTYHYNNEIGIIEKPLGSGGKFELILSDFTGEAPYKITVVGSDYEENHTMSTFILDIDEEPPTVTVKGPVGRTGNQSLGETENPVTIFGTASDNKSQVKAVYYQILSADEEKPSVDSGVWTKIETTGAWSKTLDETQVKGKYKLYVYSEDNAGNLSSVNDGQEYHIDYETPAVTVNGVSYSSNKVVPETVAVSAGDFKYEYSVRDDYGIDAAATVLTVKKGGVSVSKDEENGYSVSEDGKVTFNGTSAGDGTYEFTVHAVDKVGKITEVKNTIKLDTAGPTVSLTTPTLGADVWQTTKQLKVGGNIEDASAVHSVWFKKGDSVSKPVPVEGKTVLHKETWTTQGWTEMTLAGSGWQYLINGENPEFDDGSTVLNFAAIDEHGNVSEYFGQKLNIDSDTPTLKITTDGSTEVSDVVSKEQTTLIIVPADNHIASVKISGTGITGESVISAESSAYKFTIPEAEGKYSYTVKVTDKAGREASKAVNVTYDKTAPVVNATYITTESKNEESKVQFPINWTNATKMTLLPGTITETVSGIASADYFVSETIYQMPDSSVDGLWIPVSVKNGTVASQDIVLSDNTSSTTSQYVYFRVTDNAGNTVYLKSADGFRIDTELPSGADLRKVDGEDYAGRKLANGEKNVEFTVQPADSKSGVASVQALYNGKAKGSPVENNTSGVFSLNINGSDITGSGSAQIGVRVKDNAGNTADFNLFNITIDTTAPSDLEISTIPDASTEDGYQVNKQITIKGSANDDQNLASVTLQYMTKTKTGDTWGYTDEWVDVPTTGTYNWSAEINTLAKVSEAADAEYIFADKQAFKIRIVAEDAAGNKAESTPKELIVNQDTDIPVITIDGIKVDGKAYVKQADGKITGSIDDDDGFINLANDGTTEGQTGNYMLISTDGSNWNKVTSLGTTRWTYNLGADGQKTIYFKVKDLAGNEFTKSSTQKIIIKGDEDTTADKLECTVDTKEPTADVKIFKGTTELQNQSDYKFSEPVDENLILKITATDASGIEKIEAYFDEAPKKTESAVTSGTEVTIEVPLPNDKTQSVKTLTYKVYDKSGLSKTNSYSITVDNVAPSLTVSLPSSTTSIAGDTTVKGTTSDGTGGSGVSSVKWFIPSNQQVAAWAKTGEEAMTATAKDALFTNIINGTYTWAIEFNAESAAGKLQAFYSSTTAGGTTTWHNYPAGGDSSTTYGTQVDGSSALYDLPIYFRIEDNVGNVAYHTSYTVRVNPDGDRPVATILYPTLKEDPTTHVMGPDTLSGSIRINGDASDEVDEVKEVHIQIQKSKDNTNTEDTEWEDVAGYSDVLATGTYKWNYSFDSSESAFDPEVVDREPATATHLRFRAWAKDAKDLEGDKSEWTVIRTDKDNPLIGKTNKLRIVKYKNDTASTLTSDVLSTLEYEEGMYVSGTVFLEFSVEDASGLKEITAVVGTNSIIESMDFVPKNGDPVDSLVKDSEGSHENQPELTEGEGYYGYDKVRVKLVTAGSGNLNFTIKAVENTDTGLTSSREIKLRYDNTAPTLENLKHGGVEVGNEAGKVTVKQSNASYSLKSVIDENESGLAQMFMFWTRTKSGEGNESKKRVYDPRKSVGNVFYSYTDKEITKTINFNGDGLPYCRYTKKTAQTEETENTNQTEVTVITGLTATTTSTFTLETADPFLTVANYVLIDGSYRKITGIEGTTYTFAPASEAKPSTVDAIYAIAIDNERTESSDLLKGDDGDGIWESLVDAGATYDWEMNFNSHNIPDGPITISSLAIDNAGNISDLQKTDTKIENNAPRIAKVMLGTDLNKDKSISKSEITVYDRYKEENNLTDVADLSSEIALDTKKFTVKSGFAIIPEFVGGNGDSMKMVLKRGVDGNKDGNQTYITYLDPDSTATTGEKGELMVSEFTPKENVMTSIYTPVVTGDDDERSMLSTKKDGVRERVDSSFKKFFLTNAELFGTGTIENTASGRSEKIGLTFWDATEETVQGTDSQTAVLYLTNMKYEMVDKEAPKVVIKPFKWVSKDDNSLYENSTANGHIELEDDLSGGTWNGYTENAPKVSGKIVFRGTAYDNVGLSKLKFAFGSSTNANAWIKNNVTATYSNGSWTYTSNGGTMTGNSPDGWTLTVKDEIQSTDKNFTATDAYFGQDGHKVAWEFALDTEKWTNAGTNPAAIGAKLTVTAEDNSTDNSGFCNSSSTENSTGTQEGTLTGVALDRVKNKSVYVMDVVPYITKVTTGRLSRVKEGYDDTIFNRTAKGHYPVNVESGKDSITLEGFNLGTTRTVDPTTLTTTTKIYTHTVNGVGSINNINNNSAKGTDYSTAYSLSNKDTWNHYYNMYQNEANNNNLSDDVIFDLWEFNAKAARTYEDGGDLREPIVKINPTNGLVGMAFGNAGTKFSMPFTEDSTTSYSFKQYNYATYINIAMAWDENGKAHAVSTGLDTYAQNEKAGRMSYMYSGWGNKCGDGDDGNFKGKYANRFECIGVSASDEDNKNIVNGEKQGTLILYEHRFRSPSIAVTTKGSNNSTSAQPRIYFAYYDDIWNQIRFRVGELPSNNVGNIMFGQFYHIGDNEGAFRNIGCTAIAGTNINDSGTEMTYTIGERTGQKLPNAGEFVSIDVIPGTKADEDVVVAVWYDAIQGRLLYSYNKSPMAKVKETLFNDGYDWAPAKTVRNNAGEHCKIKVDSNGGIHIASKTESNQVVYCYLSDYTQTPDSSNTVILENYEPYVTEIGIDAKVVGSNVIPYITYWANNKPKLAYVPGGFATGSLPESVSGTSYTGNWEVTFLPSSMKIVQDHMNVCAVSSTIAETGTSEKFHTTGGNSTNTVYTNGTQNPFMGYVAREGTRFYIETAQMK